MFLIVNDYCFLFLYLYSINNRAKLSFAKKKIHKKLHQPNPDHQVPLGDLEPFFLLLQNRKPNTDRRLHQTVQRRHSREQLSTFIKKESTHSSFLGLCSLHTPNAQKE